MPGRCPATGGGFQPAACESARPGGPGCGWTAESRRDKTATRLPVGISDLAPCGNGLLIVLVPDLSPLFRLRPNLGCPLLPRRDLVLPRDQRQVCVNGLP
ncbi:hypothetical protein FHR33_004760 [Nonomuraea dietziae]|uniref:Uncharacterized protein n=1 Tax=Nonomuraea dietziae TaxID=65515 RepID=A0A7W5V7W3_9ACTN|nr:hypothetical protein [Nonomuraea dietziae]